MTATSKYSVLLVDDDATNNFLNARLFKQFNVFYPPLVFSKPQSALDYLQQPLLQHKPPSLPELMLIDINMPAMDGFEFVEVLIKMYPQLLNNSLLCFLSSSSHLKDKERCSSLGVHCYYQKPLKTVHIQELITTLQSRY